MVGEKTYKTIPYNGGHIVFREIDMKKMVVKDCGTGKIYDVNESLTLSLGKITLEEEGYNDVVVSGYIEGEKGLEKVTKDNKPFIENFLRKQGYKTKIRFE